MEGIEQDWKKELQERDQIHNRLMEQDWKKSLEEFDLKLERIRKKELEIFRNRETQHLASGEE